jgi:hypothetical protein
VTRDGRRQPPQQHGVASRLAGGGAERTGGSTRRGTTSCTPGCAHGSCASTARPKAAWRSTATSRRLHDSPTAPREPASSDSRAATAPRRSSSDRHRPARCEPRAPMSLPLARFGGLPIEETFGSVGPALLVALGAVAAKLRARCLRLRPPAASQRTARRVMHSGLLRSCSPRAGARVSSGVQWSSGKGEGCLDAAAVGQRRPAT